ncbi:MAG: head maturation protease, ClpP-related [Parasphingorhabdus sp.]
MHKLNIQFVNAKARPDALPIPQRNSLKAFTKPEVFEKWADEVSQLRASDEAQGNVIEMYDNIGYDWWTGGGITAKSVSDQLRKMRGQDVEIRINSPGGDMFEGIAIYNVLREHDGEISVKIMGMAASAASIIAMAGDTIKIGSASFIMIHNCWVIAVGNQHDMRETAEWLAPFDQAMADVYAARTAQDINDIVKWMDSETYMSGTTAIERGFADELLSSDSMVEDDDARAQAKEVHSVRAMEMSLMASGQSRSQARAHINKIKGKPDAAQSGTQDAADTDWMQAADAMLQNLKK